MFLSFNEADFRGRDVVEGNVDVGVEVEVAMIKLE